MTVKKAHFILYVADQQRAMEFYSKTLGTHPKLHVPGMTEFDAAGAVLGLMPDEGAARLLDIDFERLEAARGTPRAEVYLLVDDPEAYHERAITAGAIGICALRPRDWGHEVAYSLDLDGHVLAFAKEP